mmetsp:Transcript_12594/g.36028  ORF Transcript_12594/g.36028 Transcript_12594/m.36028 type:complete len:356 (+) Transcript_12594:1151-2218(+)
MTRTTLGLFLPMMLMRLTCTAAASIFLRATGEGYQLTSNPNFEPGSESIESIATDEILYLVLWSGSINVKSIKKKEYSILFDSGEQFKGHFSNMKNGYFAASNLLGGKNGGPTGPATVTLRLVEHGDNGKVIYRTRLTRAHTADSNLDKEEHRGTDGTSSYAQRSKGTPSSTPSLAPSILPTSSLRPSTLPTALHSTFPTQCVADGHSCINQREDGNEIPIPCCSSTHACIVLPGIGSARCITTEPPTGSPSMHPSKQASHEPSLSKVPSIIPSSLPSRVASAFPTASVSPTAPCVHCSNNPSTPMSLNNRTCEDWRLTKRKCQNPSYHWRVNKSCKRSCYFAGYPYDDDVCCRK